MRWPAKNHWIELATTLVVLSLAVLALRFVFNAQWAVAIAGVTVFALAVFLNGWLGAVEDDMPGGFNNPGPQVKKQDSEVE